ncbi:MAG: carboxymuconolactone decarboxylase family protein [Betaproteobacteria bacterium]|nr:carboxymuconolactone decarboxylase family protein [Betaproteobacteria bacterium]
MSRIEAVNPKEAIGETKELLDAVQQKLGIVPNFLRVFAHSPKALAAFLGLFENIGQGVLDPKIGERIALAVAESNGCQYCVSAHTAIAQKAGLSHDEIVNARNGGSVDAKADAAVKLASALNKNRGSLTTMEFAQAKEAGLSDAEIIEIVTHVGLNFLTNMIGKSMQVKIDFPEVQLLNGIREAA